MRVDRREKDVELAEEPGGRRDSGEREHEYAEGQSEARLGASEPGEVGDALDHLALLPHAQDDRPGAEVHEQIDRHVDENAADPGWARRGKPDQRVADMADRAVR